MSESVAVTDARQSGVFWLANDIIDKHGRELGPFGIAAYCALVRHADKAGRCFPSLATLANETGMSKSSLLRALADIQRLGLVNVERRSTKERGKVSNIYTLVSAGAPSVCQTLAKCQPDTRLVSDADMKEYPLKDQEESNDSVTAGAVADAGGEPNSAAVEAVVDSSHDSAPVGAPPSKPPRAKRPDKWAPFKERWRASLNLPIALATWQYSQKSVAVAVDNGLDTDAAIAAWDRFVADAKATNEWRFVTRQTADERFARWLADSRATTAAAFDDRGNAVLR